ncbi:MAG: SAM-dependent methyltransferase [Chloroflexota bacterium]
MSSDATKPNISRIYDYMLGGFNNFEPDRRAAEEVLKVFPAYPRWAKLNRWFLQLVAEQWAAQGEKRIMDLGSGLPTQGHLHTILPDAKILYTDNDAIAVAYARELLQDTPNVRYEQVDMRDASMVITMAEQTFGSDRQVAIGCIGISYFIDDTHLQELMHALHDWAAPGSIMALTAPYSDILLDDTRETVAWFKRNNAEIFSRNEEMLRTLCAPWKMATFKPLSEWLDVKHLMHEADYVDNTEFNGVVFEHAETKAKEV